MKLFKLTSSDRIKFKPLTNFFRKTVLFYGVAFELS